MQYACKHCQAPFQDSSKIRVFCSIPCATLHNNPKIRQQPEDCCLICQTKLSDPGKYCSSLCQRLWEESQSLPGKLTRHQKAKLRALAYKGACCSSCGYSTYVGALHFHHLDPSQKDLHLSRDILEYPWERIQAELDKCILLCGVCHAEEHERNPGPRSQSSASQTVIRSIQKTKRRAILYKGGACVCCQYAKSASALVFHHLDSSQKDFGVSGGSKSWKRIQIELDKCALLCVNCHYEVHAGKREILTVGITAAEGILRIQQEGLAPLRPRMPSACVDCGKAVSSQASRCSSCARSALARTKIAWPSPKDLFQMVQETSVLGAARQLGVSDNAVRKHMRKHPVKE